MLKFKIGLKLVYLILNDTYFALALGGGGHIFQTNEDIFVSFYLLPVESRL